MQEQPDIVNTIADAVLQGMVNAISSCGLEPITRAYVGFGPTPSEDCCPDLVVWATNYRLYDQSAPDTLIEAGILQHFGLAFDLSIRLGLPFFEMDGDKLTSTENIRVMSGRLNEYGRVAYLSSALTANQHSDIQPIENITFVAPTPASEFQSGGCAGFQWSITFGLL